MRPKFSYKTSFLVAASLLVTALAAAAIDAYTLKRTAKAGDTTKSKVTLDLEANGMSINAAIDAVSKVIDVKADGTIVEESVQKHLVVTAGGSELANQDDAGKATTTRDARGIVSAIETSEDGGGNKWRNERIISLIYPEKPVNIGDKWTYESKADKSKDLPLGTFTYEVKGKEKVKDKEVLRINYTFKETGVDDAIESEGYMLVSIATGEVLKSDGKVKNYPIPQLGPTAVKYKQEVVD
ncbi:MAG: hypothetical protein JSS65_01745 [Armatimonadetes bacterium]|nr:hypothetical protein [Armatimonadota bacterium]